MKEIQIRLLETLVALLGKVNAGIDRAQEAINGALDCLQSRATKVLNDRIENLAQELLIEAVAAAQRPHLQAADCEYELERLAYKYELMKAEIEAERRHVLSAESLDEAKAKSNAYLDKYQAILSRKK